MATHTSYVSQLVICGSVRFTRFLILMCRQSLNHCPTKPRHITRAAAVLSPKRCQDMYRLEQANLTSFQASPTVASLVRLQHELHAHTFTHHKAILLVVAHCNHERGPSSVYVSSSFG